MRPLIPESRAAWLHTLRRAIRMRRVADGARGGLLLPVAGGAGGLLGSSSCRRLASLLDPNAVTVQRRSLRHLLERRQARRSALLLVPDRATGMRFAGIWRLDLSRIRVTDLERPSRDVIVRALTAGGARRPGSRPWHTT